MARKLIDITGHKYNRLYVVRRHECKGPSRWFVVCDCGKETIKNGHDIRTGKTSSCGCLAHESPNNGNRTHGKSGTKTYMVWEQMKQRCKNPNSQFFRLYGGKGIRVCGRWMDFINFLSDMGEAPEGMQLDRIDGNKGYCKSNCRWATPKQQGNNTSRNRRILFNGESKTIAEWGDATGIPRKRIWDRLFKLNWPLDKALGVPVGESHAHI